MKIVHYYFKPSACQEAAALRAHFGEDDIFVVAPDEELLRVFNELADAQLNQKVDVSEGLQRLRSEFKESVKDAALQQDVDATFDKIVSILYQGMTRSFVDNSLIDFLDGFVVQLCARCFAAAAGCGEVVDGRNIVICEQTNGIPVVDWRLTESNAKELRPQRRVAVAGTYGRKIQGDIVNLGKRGSELTANILGNLLNASEVVFLTHGWTYDGAKELTYEEAAQFFSSGRPIYPPALLPAKKAGIPVSVADTSDVSQAMLTIGVDKGQGNATGITGVVCSEPMTLFTVYGTGLMGSIGISSAIFGVLAKSGVNIHFISQSSSEYSISFAVKRKAAEEASCALGSLIAEKSHGDCSDLAYSSQDVKIVSVFGYRMRNVVGISGKVYGALGQAGVNVIAASQGGEELSISIVVADKDAELAVGALR